MPKVPNENVYVFVPTQKRYRWIVVFMAFSCLFVSDGILHSYGVFLRPLAIEYELSLNIISIVHAFLIGIYLLAQPLVYGIINRYGFQITGLIGGLLCLIGYVLPIILPQFVVLVFAMGLFVAIGTSIVCAVSSVVVNFYFEQKRAVAAGLSSSGSSFGTIFFPTLLSAMESKYGIRKTLMYAGFTMIIPSIASLFFLPLTPARVLTDIDVEVGLVKNCLLERVEERKKNKNPKFGYSFCCCKHTQPKVNRYFPTVYELVSPERRKIPNLASYIYDPNVLTAHSKRKGWMFFIKSLFLCYLSRGIYGRPMYRDDIFFGGSLKTLQLYRKTVPNNTQMLKSAFYHMSVTRASLRTEFNEDFVLGKFRLMAAFSRPLRTMLDITLMQNLSYNIYLLCTLTFYGGFSIPLTYIADRACQNGMEKDMCPWLVATLGMGWTVGRISSIGLAVVKRINYKFYCAGLFTLGGLVIVFSGTEAMMRPSKQFICCFVFGFCCTTMVLMSSVLIEFYGLDNFSNAYGLSVVAMGIGTILCLLSAGIIHDSMGSYDVVFYLSGACLCTSGLCMFCLGIIGIYKKKKNSIYPSR